MNKKIEEELEKQFPKGHKSRGGALVLHAVAQIELEKAIKSVKEECAKEADLVQNPYPESVFPMNTDGYVKAIPDEHLRTAISGYCGRVFFDIAKKEIVKSIRDKE